MEAVTAAATRVLHEGASTLLTLVAVVRSAATAVVVDDVLVDEELRVVAVEPMETGVVEVTVVAVVSPSESGKDGGVKSYSASLSSSTAMEVTHEGFTTLGPSNARLVETPSWPTPTAAAEPGISNRRRTMRTSALRTR